MKSRKSRKLKENIDKLNYDFNAGSRILRNIVGWFLLTYWYTLIISIGYEVLKAALTENLSANPSKISLIVGLIVFLKIFLGYFTSSNTGIATVAPGVSKAEMIFPEALDKQSKEIISAHEAGHLVMCKLLDVKVLESSAKDLHPHVTYEGKRYDDAVSLKNRVLICYAGTIAEELLLGKRSDGFSGSEEADQETALKSLRKYVEQTNTDLSFTGLETNIINERCIELSKKWRKKAEEMLGAHIDELKNEAEIFAKDNYGIDC